MFQLVGQCHSDLDSSNSYNYNNTSNSTTNARVMNGLCDAPDGSTHTKQNVTDCAFLCYLGRKYPWRRQPVFDVCISLKKRKSNFAVVVAFGLRGRAHDYCCHI